MNFSKNWDTLRSCANTFPEHVIQSSHSCFSKISTNENTFFTSLTVILLPPNVKY